MCKPAANHNQGVLESQTTWHNPQFWLCALQNSTFIVMYRPATQSALHDWVGVGAARKEWMVDTMK